MLRSIFAYVLAFLLTVAPFGPALAQDVIGLVLPLDGRFEPVARRMEFGALAALEAARKDNAELKLTLIADGCDVEKVDSHASALKEAEVDIVVGPVCFQYAVALAKALNPSGIQQQEVPVLVTGARNKGLERLRAVDGVPLYSISNAHDAEARAVVRHILPRFKGKPFALLDDGSVYGRSLSDSVRLLGEQDGLKPTQASNFRPLQSNQISTLRRLAQSGIEAIFVAASAQDVVTIAKDMGTLGLNWTIATGEQAILLPFTENAQTVPAGLLMVQEALPPDLSNPELFESLKGDDDLPSRDLYLGYTLIQIAAQSFSKEKRPQMDKTFNTSLGPIRFDGEGRATPLPMTLFEWDGGGLKPVQKPAEGN